jgi:hypothetical protein
MDTNETPKELRILITMRKVLSSIVRETTPPAGMRHPLTETTIEDVKHCFALIAARERELNDDAGNSSESRPKYADEPKTTHVVPFTKPRS